MTTYIHEYIECILPEVSGESFPTIGFELCESAAEVHESSHVGELRMGLHNVQLPAAANGVAQSVFDGCEVVSQTTVELYECKYVVPFLRHTNTQREMHTGFLISI